MLRSTLRKAVLAALLAAALVALLEGFSFVGLAMRDGGLPSPGRWRAERERVAQESGGAAAATDAAARGIESGGMQVLHPYLGFVLNPAFKVDWRDVDAQGFMHRPGEVDPPAGTPRFVLGLFGGSVAGGLCMRGRDDILAELRRSPRLQGKTIVVRCFAMGGYKQPQQLMALSYALSLGYTFDLVVDVDGVNEATLPIHDNLSQGVNPFYPRGWSTMVAGAPSVEALKTVGRIAAAKDERLQRSRLCASRPLAWSPSCHLLWTALDRRLAHRIYEGERALASLAPAEQTFVARGPAFAGQPRPQVCRQLADEWARSSTLMNALARDRGTLFLHFLQPNQYLPGSKPMGRQERLVAVDPAHPYKPAIEDCYPVFVEAGQGLAAHGVPFHDLTQLFAGHPEPLYDDTCCHYNDEGYRLVAQAIGRAAVDALAGAPQRKDEW